MTVYVDEIRQYPKQWCHMWCDADLDELHQMADKIGLKRSWFQTKNARFPHYDITPSKRALALKHGAVFIPLKDWIMSMRSQDSVQFSLFDYQPLPSKLLALSLWQPWALLVALSLKKYETRHWSTNYRGLLAIHATKRWTRDERACAARFAAVEPRLDGVFGDPPLGAMLCVVRLVNVVRVEKVRDVISSQERSYGDYSDGRYAWQMEIVEVFEQPILITGKQGMWEWSR